MRKLVIFVSAFSLAVLVSIYLLPVLGVVISAGITAIISVGFVFFNGKARSRYFISCIGLAAGFIYFFIHSAVFTFPAEKFYDTSKHITATVLSYPKEYTAVVSLETNDTLNIRTSLYCPSGFPQDAKPGDVVTAYADFRAPSADYLYTSGIKLYANAESITVTKGENSIRYLGAHLAHNTKTVIDNIFPENTQAFAKALITGDKTDFYDDPLLESSFRTAGLSHIVAVSGMHLSFILAIPSLVIKNRRRFSLISIPCILFFIAFAGFTPSVCRAGIMHICVAAANLTRREPDDYTSLFSAAFIILLFDPYAAASISLQLSFAAVLGITTFSSRIYLTLTKPFNKIPRILGSLCRIIINLFSASIGALIFTTPLCAIYFGTVSLAAPVTSVLVLGILSFTFCLTILACVIGSVFLPLGVVTAKIASIPLQYIMWVADSISKSNFAAVYTSNHFTVIWLVITYVLFIAVFAARRPIKAYILPVCLSAVGICIIVLTPALKNYDTSLKMTALNVGQGQCIVITTGNMTAVIDCGSSSGEDAGKIAADYLHSRGINTIDLLILTHYHADHVNGVSDLISEIETTAYLLPPQEDYTTYDDEIISIAQRTDGQVVFIDDKISADMGKTQITAFPAVDVSGVNESCCSVLCSNDNYDILITGDMPDFCERILMSYASLPDLEVFVAGHHGSAGSSSTDLLESLSPEIAVVSVGKNNYGHPAEETLERFDNYGIIVLRTDLVGNVILD